MEASGIGEEEVDGVKGSGFVSIVKVGRMRDVENAPLLPQITRAIYYFE